jgi:hypothetical protein
MELHFYFPSGPSWPVLGWNLPLPYKKHKNIYLNVERKRFLLRHQSHRTADVFTPTVRSIATAHSINKQQCHVPLKVEHCELFVRPCAFHTIRNRPLTSALCAGMDRTYLSQQILISTTSGIKNTSTLFGCDQLRAPTALLPGTRPQ